MNGKYIENLAESLNNIETALKNISKKLDELKDQASKDNGAAYSALSQLRMMAVQEL